MHHEEQEWWCEFIKSDREARARLPSKTNKADPKLVSIFCITLHAWSPPCVACSLICRRWRCESTGEPRQRRAMESDIGLLLRLNDQTMRQRNERVRRHHL